MALIRATHSGVLGLHLETDLAALDAMTAPFSKRRADRIIQTALNTTLRQGRTEAARKIARYTSIRVGLVKADLKPVFARAGDRKVKFWTSSKPIGLYKMGKARQTRRGASARAWGKRRVYPSTFIARMPNGHMGVFVREGRRRVPLHELYGPGVAQALSKEEVRAPLIDKIEGRFETNLLRQIDRAQRVRDGRAGR